MINNRVDQIEEERWAKLISDFEEFHKNEREMRSKEYDKKIEDARNQGLQQGLHQGLQQKEYEMIQTLSKSMSVDQIAAALDKTPSEIKKILDM